LPFYYSSEFNLIVTGFQVLSRNVPHDFRVLILNHRFDVSDACNPIPGCG